MKMKRCLACLLALWLFCAPALAEPRYPETARLVSDNAAVLSSSIAADLNTMNRMLDDLQLYVVTVDFLDGATLAEYAEGLREAWDLDEDEDALLLMAVGEDQCGLFLGDDWPLGHSLREKLMSTHFTEPFLKQDYNRAIAALMPALAEELNKTGDDELDMTGLFGVTAAAPADTWLHRGSDWEYADEDEEDFAQRFSDEDDDTGFSLGKVVLTVILLMVIFGNHKKGRYYHGRQGCGCFPFSSLLAALGIWKLWDRK